ncbi:DUF2807 domain-containing protein [Terrimonas sp. NA20]|uniref:DUF2807 domain-containing protein n=1 Tax=Terrimonas ginsenosidimutans TaxID=2908004 RepID=A0ABS9KRM6_9BACT|nr:DUF2807 domain-containing protein [Terrimonas ginsenosidimutans]MCG2614925.1 DUF2807 domain-containing protein [Terrimonas ginsenosidimutans]
MKPYLFFFFTLMIAIVTAGCTKPGCTGNAGPAAVQERDFPAFSTVRLQDNIDLVLIQSDDEKIEISGPQNIIANVQTVVANEELVISNQTGCRWLRDADEKVKVRLFVKDIALLKYEGSGNVSNMDTLKFKAFRINSETGAGNVELTVDMPYLAVIILKENASMIMHGKAGHVETYTNARGLLNLSDLKTKTMYMIYSGLADTHIQVADELDATIRYKGNVYCKGYPIIKRSDYFSSGQLFIQP